VEIGAFEAKNRLSQLLDLVERGEEVIITRHGRSVARLVPVQGTRGAVEARAAITRIRARAEAKGGRFEWYKWKAWREQGRA